MRTAVAAPGAAAWARCGHGWRRFPTQPQRQQASGVTLEDQHGVIHVLAVSAVEEAELLLAVGGIVGGIEVKQNLAALSDLLAAETDELRAPGVAQAN